MKKMFTRFLFLAITGTLLLATANAQFPTIYASVASGSYNVAGTWETFTNSGNNTPGAQGTGTPAVTAPSGTHFVYIRSGHTITMNGGNRSCFGLFVEAGGKLWANEPAARRLQLVNGGTGFTYPQVGTITNNGTLGGIGDGLYFEAGTNCQSATITGTGSTIVQRLRIPGGLASLAGGVVNITFDQDVTFTQAANYAVSAIYNPQASDNYTVTLNAGKTMTLTDAAGYFNSNSIGSGAGFGTYTYNINGTLDLSASTQTATNLTAFSPTDGTINFNLTGALKTGAAFNSSPVAPGVANLNVANGVTIDATLATVMNFNGNALQLTGTAAIKRAVPNDGTKVVFPVGTGGSFNHVTISGNTGAAETFTVGLKSTFTNPAPPLTLPREWNITEATAGGNTDTLRFAWTTADVGASGFNSTGTVYIAHWNGSGWSTSAASVTGTGTVADPYVAKPASAGVFTSFGLFALTNSTTTPVSLVNVKASQKQNSIQVEFSNATELDVANYVIEKSNDGRSFSPAITLQPKSNNGSLSSYSFIDAAPFSGNNFYRIMATEKNGNIKYSAVININTKTTGTRINVYPNPVNGSSFNVQFENMDKGTYTMTLINGIGQKVFDKLISHNGNSSTFVAELPTSVKGGIYSLQISSSNFREIKSIVIQ